MASDWAPPRRRPSCNSTSTEHLTIMLPADQTLPSSVAPPTLLTPRADLFVVRSDRLHHLASRHSLSNWLNWLAQLAAAQQKALDQLPPLDLPPVAPFDPARPPLQSPPPALTATWPDVCAQLCAGLQYFTSHGPIPFSPSPASLTALGRGQLAGMQKDCLDFAAGQVTSSPQGVVELLVAAAMQVVWTAAARQLELPGGAPLNDSDTCPCCGSAPVASIVMAGDGKAGLRYLECSLCATRWNTVRARCTLCDNGPVVNYLGLEGGNPAIQAETCDHCRGYIKTFFQNKDPLVEPTADDLASLMLDVLVGEQGYSRATPNLFLIAGRTI